MSQKEISEGKRPSIWTLCDFLGISRQGYYQHTSKENEVDILRSSIVLYCQEMRAEKLPRAGMRELYELCCRHFSEKMVVGRDQCFDVFRANGLVLRQKKRPRTTNSNHNYYIYPDLLNTTPKYVALCCGQLAVVDITYVATESGWAYLSLATDAATRIIIGYALHPSLDREGPLNALEMALDFYRNHGIDISNLIHHSARGAQYCSNEYIAVLKENRIRISMTQTGDPLHNALAERMNNTLKNGWLFDCEGDAFEIVKEKIKKAVYVYNNIRPHQALAMKTPIEAFEEARMSASL